MSSDQVLILESDAETRLTLAEFFSLRSDISFTIVDSVPKAIEMLQTGHYGRFRANFISDEMEHQEGSVFYARDAMKAAISLGVTPEIWSVNTPTDVYELMGEIEPELAAHIHIYKRQEIAATWFTDAEAGYLAGKSIENRKSGKKEM